MMPPQPVSSALEADLRATVRKHGVVAWLDADGHYTGFVDRLVAARAVSTEQVPFALLAYRGSHLALMLEAEGVAAGVERTGAVLHLPRFTEERVHASPVLEMYAAGVRYRKALDTLVTDTAAGRVQPEVIKAFLAEPGLTLERADAWLAALLDERAGGLAAQLQAMSVPAIIDDLLSGGFVATRLFPRSGEPSSDVVVLWDHLGARCGLTRSWREHALSTRKVMGEDVAFALCSWAMCVEYVSDLGRPPVASLLRDVVGLPPVVVQTCGELAAHLRERHARAYTRWADETEVWLGDEVSAAKPRDLGKIDTLRFEEDVVLRGALDAMESEPEDWKQVLVWADARLGPGASGSFWVRQDDARLGAWQLIAAAARLGLAIDKAGPDLNVRGTSTAVGLTAAVDRYVAHGVAVDQAHRQLEQVRAARSHMQLPERDALRARVSDARVAWRRWADDWSAGFNALCKQDGFLPAASLQQRTLFDEVVRPMTTEHGVTALFTVDALRYEMAEELYRTLKDTPATTVQLRARLAELPTVTEVGMNVLSPLCTNGRLRPTLKDGKVEGFSAGEFRVSDPETRRRAMADRVGGATCPLLTLDEVIGRDVASLKLAVARANLVLVHSKEIDTAGENGVGPNVFESVLQKLRAAWQLLREAGVRRFVITADHGYLLLDETAVENAQPHGRKIDAKRRHAFSDVPADHDGEARVSLAALGYEGPGGALDGHLMFPLTTAIFSTGKHGMSFVHGGNSLQERVIPVLTLVHRAPAGADTQIYEVKASVRDGVAGMHCIEARIESPAQGALAFGGARELDIALRVVEVLPGRPEGRPEGRPDVRVDICDVRGAARRLAGTIRAEVGSSFEVFFRLTGASESRVQVEVQHPGAEAKVTPCVLDARFLVGVAPGHSSEPAAQVEAPRGGDAWLAQLPEGGPRQVFAHIAAHGAVTEAEAHGMFATPRALRAFALAFESHAAMAPFGVRIDTVGGMKRYVREAVSEPSRPHASKDKP